MADKKWVNKAIKRPGALREKTHTKEGKNIPVGTLQKLAKEPGRTGRQARLALTMRKWHKGGKKKRYADTDCEFEP